MSFFFHHGRENARKISAALARAVSWSRYIARIIDAI